MTSGPVVIMELEGVNAVKVWDKLKGPSDLKKVNKDQSLVKSDIARWNRLLKFCMHWHTS